MKQESGRRGWGRWAVLLAAGMLVMGVMGSGLDRLVASQVFFPERELAATPDQAGLEYEDQWLTTGDGVRLHAWWLPAPGAETVLLFCHGNAGNISHRLDNLSRFRDRGLSLFIFDYRGYGRSQGTPSEQGMYRDVEAAYAAARQRARDTGARLVVFGRSLGGIAACRVASRPGVAGLILESSFPDLGAMAALHFPLPGLGRALARRFNARADLERVTVPLLFFHGDRDDIVPIELGRRLFQAAAGPKRFVTLTGAGHNDTYLVGGEPYFEQIDGFLDSLPRPQEERP